MTVLDDYKLLLAGRSYVPLMLGGMGVDISTAALALEFARLGGIGHISDAMTMALTDRRHGTRFLSEKARRYRDVTPDDMSAVHFDLAALREATLLHVGGTMALKQGPGAIFVNVMEKLTMNAPKETLRVRLEAALDAGVDGITLSAGLHLGSFELMRDHPRFREASLGIIVSSVRALKLFIQRAKRSDRLPDYVVVEGPLAGGHLGFGPEDWREANLLTIFDEVKAWVEHEGLDLPLIPAGGIFTGADALAYLERGAAAVQVATRFTITVESGLPEKVKQVYLQAREEDVEVNMQSPTGYPMRMLKSSPAIASNVKPNCAALGFLLDGKGHCKYLEAYQRTPVDPATGRKQPVLEHTCLCTHMSAFRVYTCGHYVYRLKDTTTLEAPGRYRLPTAEEVFRDYQFSAGGRPLPDGRGKDVSVRLYGGLFSPARAQATPS